MGFVKATLDFALEREDMRKEVLQYLETIYQKENILKREMD